MHAERITVAQWKDLIGQSDGLTFFELPIWYELCSNVFGYELQVYIVTQQSSRFIISFLVSKAGKGLIRHWHSGPLGTYSNLRRLDSGQSSLSFTSLLESLKVGTVSLRANPFSNVQLSHEASASEETQVLHLDHLKNLTASWSRNHRRMLKKDQLDEVEVYLATSENDWKQYYQKYIEFLKTKGAAATNKYPWELFQKIMKLPTEHCKLWLARVEDEIVAGRLCFYHHPYAVEWHAVCDADWMDVGVNQLLIVSILRDARKSGCTIYDFNPSAGQEGVIEFKRKFGTEKLPCPMFERSSYINGLYDKYLNLFSA